MIKFSLSEKRIIFGTLSLFLVLFGLMFTKIASIQDQLKDTEAETSKQIILLQNEIANQKLLLKPVTDLDSNTVVFPEAGIRLPYNDVTKTFRYTYDSGEYGYLRVTSTLISDYEGRQLSCSELALISFNNGSALNPWTEAAGSVQLSDKRTMHIISPIAFENNEASTTACESEVWTTITPKQVADEFKKAESL